MPSLVAYLTDIQDRLDALADQHGVPGAVLAVRRGNAALDFATGVANRNTGARVTTGTAFQIGSITKVLTTTMVMQLVDAGEVELDVPVRRYVPAFELAEPGPAADEITLRHLLTHTSGIEGDHFDGFGRGDDAIERYVTSLRYLGLIHRPGQLWSYCNSGYVLAGHVLEKVTGLPYHQILRERICEPLNLRRMTVLAEEMLGDSCAVGHLLGSDGTATVPPVVLMETAHAPAGSRTVATAAEVAAFARAHLTGGLAADGARMLSAASTGAMTRPEVVIPPRSTGQQSQGLGWMLADWDGLGVIEHTGDTIGQAAFLTAIPERELVVVLLTNATTGGLLWRDLGGWLFEALADARMPAVPRPADPPPDLRLETYAGIYERLGVRYEVTVEDGGLLVLVRRSGPIAELQGGDDPPLRLRPVDFTSFYVSQDGDEGLVSFLDWEAGRPGYLFTGRAARRLN